MQPPQGTRRGTAQPGLQAGMVVGRYRIEKQLGKGAMGEVYLAVDDALNRRAAIKILGRKHRANNTVKERFLREARSLANLTHPNVITVYESGYVDGMETPYFAMELLERGDTQQLLDERGPLPGGLVATIGAQASAGLAEAARQGIIHRDVKPANLGISARGTLMVTDFSLAKSLAMDNNLTGKGMVVGTADYIAPEQAKGETLDEKADVYALGCTLFHLLTGKPPFRAEEGTEVKRYVEVMRAHLQEPIPDPRRFVAGVDDELRATISDMMDKKRDTRPAFSDVAPRLAQIAVRLQGALPQATRAHAAAPESSTVAPLRAAPGLDNAAPDIAKTSARKILLYLACGVVLGAAVAALLLSLKNG